MKPITAEVVHTVRIKVTFGGVEQDMTLEEVRSLHSTLSRALDSVLGTHGLTPIVTRVMAEFGVSRGQIMGRNRHERIARTRQVAMYLARELTGLPLENIGTYFGGRDHGTVLEAHRRITQFIEVYPKWREKISKLKSELGPELEMSLPQALPIAK